MIWVHNSTETGSASMEVPVAVELVLPRDCDPVPSDRC